MGISEFEVLYPFKLCEKGEIINYRFKDGKNESLESDLIKFSSKIEQNLDEIQFECLELNNLNISNDKHINEHEVIDKTCKCFTCTNGYTKAYINHLFKCNELNGNILVLMHNIYKIDELTKVFENINEKEKLNFIIDFIKNNCSLLEPSIVKKIEKEEVKEDEKCGD